MKIILITLVSLIAMATTLFSQTIKEQEMLNEINRLRSNPKSYIKVLEDFKKMKTNPYAGPGTLTIKSTVVTTTTNSNGDSISYKSKVDWTKECDETINFLKTCEEVDILTLDSCLYDKLNVFDFKGEHTYLDCGRNVGENFVLSSNKEMEYLIAVLLLDIGIENKGHRINLMNPKFKSVAVKEKSYNNKVWFIQTFSE